MLSLRSPLGGIASPFGQGGAADPTTEWAEIWAHNAAWLAGIAASPVTLSDDVSAWGDSLTEGTGGADPWTDELATYITNSVTNEGVGGERTDEIDARLDTAILAAAGQEDDISSLQGGTNDASQNTTTHDYSDITTNLDAMVTALAAVPNAKYWLWGGTFNSSLSVGEMNGQDREVVNNHLRTNYPSKWLNFMWPLFFGWC